MKTIRADLHVHTVLSPCAEVEMIPPLIVRTALDLGIQLIAISDHNASANIAAVQKCARGTSLTVLPGMEVQTTEEVHVLCLFDTIEQVMSWQSRIDKSSPFIENNIEFFGEQFVVDETGDFLRRENRLLLTATGLGLETLVSEVHALGGLAIPAHIDRKSFGLIANLGFVPEGLPVDALEISRFCSPQQAASTLPQASGYPLIQNGDVHRLDEFLGCMLFTIQSPTIGELRKALLNQQGRTFALAHLQREDNLRHR